MAMISRNLNLLKVSLFMIMIALGFFGLLSCSPKSADITDPQNLYQFKLKNEFGSGIVEAADWSPDGSTFALATSLGVDIYDSQTLEIIATLETGQWNQEIEYSPDGKFLAVGGEENIIQLWDLQTKELLHSFAATGPEPYYGNYLSFSFSEDGRKLVSAQYQTVYLWDVTTGDLLDSFPGHLQGIGSVALSPDDKTIVAAGTRGIFVRDVASRELLYPPIDESAEQIVSVYFAPGGKQFFTIHNSWVYESNISSSSYHESKIRYWDLSNGELLNENVIGNDQINETDNDPEHQTLILGESNGFRVWNQSTRREILFISGQTGHLNSISLSPDGKKLITVGNDFGNGLTQVWDLTNKQVIKTFDKYTLPPFGFALSPDEKLAAIIYRNQTRIMDATSGQTLYTLNGGNPIAFSPDSQIIAYTAGFNQLVFADARSGENLPIPVISCPEIKAIAFNPDGKTIAMGGDSCDLQIRDVRTGTLIKNLSQVPGNEYLYLDTLSYTPDGQMLILSGYRLKFLDAQTGGIISEEDAGYNDHLTALSPDGRYLAISGFGEYSKKDVVQIRDVASEQIVLNISTLQDDIKNLTFGADKRTLMIVGENIEFWDLWDRKPLANVKLTENPPSGVALLQNGKELLLINDKGELQHWSFQPDPQLALGNQPTPTYIPTLTTTPDIPKIELTQIAEVGRGYGSRVDYSPDGTIAAFVENNTLRWFDAKSLQELGSLEIGEVLGGVLISPNNKIAVVDDYTGAQIVDLETRQIIGKAYGGNGSAFGFTFSKDSQYLAYTVGDRTTGGSYHYINLWNVSMESDAFAEWGFFPTLLDGRYHTMSAPAISPDAKLVAAGHSDKRVYVWDLHTGETRFILEGHGGEVKHWGFSPNGKWLASGSDDGTVRIWDPSKGKLIQVITGFKNDIWRIRFMSNGQELRVYLAEWDEYRVNLSTNRITHQPQAISTPDPLEIQQYQQGFSTGNSSIFSEVLFSPDGKTLATASQNVLLWDIPTQELLMFLDNPSSGLLRGMAFNTDGSQLAATTADEQVIIWDTRSGEIIFSRKSNFLTGSSVIYGYGDSEWGPARSGSLVAEQELSFSPIENLLAFGNDNTIEIWDVTNNILVAEMVNPKGYYATQVSFSADGSRLYAIINRNRIAQIWDIPTEKLIRQVELPDVDANAFSAIALQGSVFARNNIDGQGNAKIEVWDLEKDLSVSILAGSSSNEPLVFSPNGDLLVTFGNDDNLYIWDTSTGRLVYTTKFDFYPGGASISPDNKYLAIGHSGKASIFNFEPLLQLAKQPNLQVATPQATPTPFILAWPTATPAPTMIPSSDSTTDNTKSIEIGNASQVQEKTRFSKGTIEEVIWSLDGASILVSGSMGNSEYTINTLNGNFTNSSDNEHNGWTYHSVSLPDGQILSTGTNFGRVYVWDDTTGRTLVDLEGGGEPVLSPDGNLLVYLNPDVKLEVYDIANQESLTILESYSNYSLRPIFSPDGQYVAAVQSLGWRLRYEDSIRIWNARTGEIVNALSGPDNDITNMSFSVDGKFMVGAAGGSAWVWDLRPGAIPDEMGLYPVELKDNLNIYPRKVTAATLSPDNKILAVGTSEHTLKLYDRGTKEVIRELNGHSASIRALVFSPNGQYLVSVDQDGNLILWEVASGKRLADLHDHSGPVAGLLYQLDGDLVAWGEGTTWELSPSDGQILHKTQIKSNGSILAASPAGDLLAVYEPFTVSLLDAQSGIIIQELEGEAEDPWVEYQQEGLVFRRFYAASFSADGDRLATAGTGGVWYYDTSSNRLLQQFPGNNAQKIVLSPDGQWMLTSLYEQYSPISVYDLQSGNILFSLDEAFRGSDIPQAIFSPDGHWVGMIQITWDGPYKLNIYDTVTKQLTMSIPLGEDIPLSSLAFNPTGSLVAVGRADGEILLIDVNQMDVVVTLIGHRGAVDHLIFSPDGRYLVSGSNDGTNRTWGLP